MATVMDTFTYHFSDLVLVAHRPRGRPQTTWYIQCPECKGKHMFRRTGSKVWHTSCLLSGVEWTITPAEYYIQKPLDLTRILGD